jgi:hypothetical protein
MWFFLLIATLLVVTHWRASLFILACYAAYKYLEWLQVAYRRKKAARREAERRLTSNADLEHRLVQQGSSDGIYGDFPVPAETERIGIWLCD